MPKTATAGEPDPNNDVEKRARDRALRALELPGHGYELAATRLAVGDAYLRGQGQVTAEEFKRNVYSQTNAGTCFDTPTAWWRDGCKPYLQQMPGVVPPSGAGDPWRFVGVA